MKEKLLTVSAVGSFVVGVISTLKSEELMKPVAVFLMVFAVCFVTIYSILRSYCEIKDARARRQRFQEDVDELDEHQRWLLKQLYDKRRMRTTSAKHEDDLFYLIDRNFVYKVGFDEYRLTERGDEACRDLKNRGKF